MKSITKTYQIKEVIVYGNRGQIVNTYYYIVEPVKIFGKVIWYRSIKEEMAGSMESFYGIINFSTLPEAQQYIKDILLTPGPRNVIKKSIVDSIQIKIFN
jgi:hypothetical protein